ncbi:MAG: right-handed parallel beta-helix repeat-containing protein [Candidatus Marinimicrobia bacterium]|nr:right-handed parallel beta-helix repeat-containing protein [Candidatus Neomarinimicrobiota bacterium]
MNNKGRWYINFKQQYKGVPVYRANVGFTVHENGNVVLVGSDVYPDISIDATPSISSDEALKIAQSNFMELTGTDSLVIRKEPELIIFPVENEKNFSYILSYNIELEYIDSLNVYSQVYFINAKTGEIIKEYSNIMNDCINATLNYKYWPEHYYDQQSGDQVYRNSKVRLYNLLGQAVDTKNTNSTGYVSFCNLAYNTYFLTAKFENSYVRLRNTNGLTKSLLPGTYNLSWDATDESNVYHHVNLIHDFFKNSPFNYDGMDYRMDAFINQGSSYNGWADGNSIGFGSQYGQYWARSSDVVYHEYTHNTIYHLYGNNWIGDPNNWYTQGSAMDEGFADFFACTINNDHIQGESVGVSRDLNNILEWDPSENKYYNCRVIGGACWDLREQIGSSITNKIVFDALQMQHHAYNFADFLDNMILADDDDDGNVYNGTPHDDQICDAFINNHKIDGTYLAGKIKRDITIDHFVIIIGNVTVTSGATLTIQPGVTVEFGGYYNLTVQEGGKIIAEGTEDQPIYFTAANPSGRRTWGTLFVNGSNNILKQCIVEYGDWGLKLRGSPSPASGNVVENCIFRKNDQGLRIENNTVDVRNCQIYDNRHNVVLIGNQDVDIEGCRIYNGDRDGIYSSNGNYVELYGNVIENNGLGSSSTRNGIYTNWNDIYYIVSCNTIRNNYSSEVSAYYDDKVEVGYSSIHDDNGYEVYNRNSGKIFCYFSWWGEYPPDYSQFYGDVTIVGYLYGRPSWEGQTRSGGLSKIVAMNLDNNNPDDDNITYESLKEKILSNPYFPEADSLLSRMYVIARKDFRENKYGLRKSFYNFLKNLRKQYPDTKISKKSLEYMIIWKMLEGDYNKAISHSKEALACEAGEEKRYMMLNLAYLYSNMFEFKKAERLIKKYKEKCGIDDRVVFMEETVKNIEYEYNKGYIKPIETSEEERMLVSRNDNIILNSPYPNPFNPITTISFQIPEEARLKAEVFDILGRRVSILTERKYTPGVYSISFDGKNLPSGIYFIRINYDPVDEGSKSKVFVRKVLLAK